MSQQSSPSQTRVSSRRRRRRRGTPEPTTRKFQAEVRSIFINAGFTHLPVRNLEVNIAGKSGEFDAVFVFENVVLFVEETTRGDVGDHIRRKYEFWRHVTAHRHELFDALAARSDALARWQHESRYSIDELRLRHVYCPLHPISHDVASRSRNDFKVIDRPCQKYFLAITKSIRRSARFEIFSFLQLKPNEIGVARNAHPFVTYKGLILPHVPSGFPRDHRLVSFLADPATLLEQCYVLRSDGWRDSAYLYQRLIVQRKIKLMREYLAKEQRVYVNNIIATLPPETRLEASGDENDVLNSHPGSVKISIPRAYNTIGVIDGQHRLFSYHEATDDAENSISLLREKQHLLVTGIVYPSASQSRRAREAFEAKLFMEINDKQTRVKSELRQEIEMIVEPFSPLAIAKAVMKKIAHESSLRGVFQVRFYDTGIKTSSIVSYGLRHIVGIDSEHSLFSLWSDRDKDGVRNKGDHDALARYVQYCASEIACFISAFRSVLPDEQWTPDKKISMALTTTTMNGLIYCVRLMIKENRMGDFAYYVSRLRNHTVNFATVGGFDYRSSHWKALGEKIFADCFKNAPPKRHRAKKK